MSQVAAPVISQDESTLECVPALPVPAVVEVAVSAAGMFVLFGVLA